MADIFGRMVAPFVQRNGWSKNQQARHYKRTYNIWDHQQDKYGGAEVPAATEMEDVTTTSAADFQQNVGYWNNYVYQSEQDKVARLSTWREMALFPEISFALNEINDEAINFNDEGNFIELHITNPRLNQNENIVKNLVKEWNYIIKDVMKAGQYINEWFMDFMSDAEIFIEKVIDPTAARERGIVDIKRLRPEFTYPIWEDIETDDVNQFIHKKNGNILVMPPQMIAYANSGIYDYPDEFTKIVISYLEDAKISYRKLKQIEDAVVIYRLVKSVDRRVFKIDVGNLPRARAEQVIKDTMRKYRQRQTYDPNTGETSQSKDTMAMIEDFFFPNFGNGRGHTVETLPGGENLGQIEDVLYFLDKLYRALKVPMSRMKADTGFSLGDTSDITREEVRFNKLVTKFMRRFKQIFMSVYMSHLRLKGYANEFGLTEKDFEIDMLTNNLFQEFLETNVFNNRADSFERFMPFTEPGEDGSEPMLSKRWLMKRFLKFTDEEMMENEQYMKAEKEKLAASGGGAGGGGDDDLGGLGGLDDLGGLGDDLGGGGDDDLGGLDDLDTDDLDTDTDTDNDDDDSFA